MANSSSASNTSTNTSSGSQTSSQNSSNTSESKSNGNFSGGSLNSGTSFSFGKGSSLSSEPGYAHGDFSLAGNLGWTPSISLNGSSSGKSSNMFTGATYDSSTGQTSYNTSYVSGSGSPSSSSSSSSSSTTVTVDDVFGTGATTIDVGKFNPDNKVEAKTQGDYEASKETKSDVSTNTFGKQEEITVTPESVTENKGLASNQVIDSVEGLAKTQKDKESQEVLDASKKRGEAEEADVSNKMRDNLKAAGQVEDETENVNKFQIGEEVGAKEQQDLNNAENELNKTKAQIAECERYVAEQEKNVKDMQENLSNVYNSIKETDSKLEEVKAQIKAENEANGKKGVAYDISYIDFSDEGYSKEAIVDLVNQTPGLKDSAYKDTIITLGEAQVSLNKTFYQMEKDIKDGKKTLEDAYVELSTFQAKEKIAQKAYDNAKETYDNLFTSVPSEEAPDVEEAPAVVEETPTIQESQEAFNTAKEAIANSANTEEAAAANEIISKVEETQGKLTEAIDTIEKAGGLEKANPAAIEAWVNAQKEYNKNIDEALKASNAFTQTDFNKEFTRSIALANDFEVTLADGTKTTYSQFTTDMVTKSPQIAAAMYQAKAQRYEEQHHKFLAAVENKKAEMMSQPGFFNALGRSLLGADNQVRDQFTKMSEANMRATYATYNNVLNNPNATDEQKAEARAQIAQANSLMQASTVLKASTGLLTGLGDSMTDGVYGVTEASQLNGFQDFAAKFGMATQAIMGLAVTPAANKAYQKALYLNPEDNGFFTRDFDNDGFALCQEYGNNAAAELVGCGTELVAGVALCFNPTTLANGLNLVYDAIRGSVNAVYGVRKRAESAELATNKVLEYFKTAEELKGLPTEVKDAIDQGIAGITEGTEQIEDFELKSDEVGNLNNWLEGSGSNTASNDKFNQSLSYDEWLKLIESDETMRNYAKKLTENAKKSDVDTGVNA